MFPAALLPCFRTVKSVSRPARPEDTKRTRGKQKKDQTRHFYFVIGSAIKIDKSISGSQYWQKLGEL